MSDRDQNWPLGTGPRGRFQILQALEDAIAFRMARAAIPCLDCEDAGGKCDDHACDVQLVASYRQTLAAAPQRPRPAPAAPATAASVALAG